MILRNSRKSFKIQENTKIICILITMILLILSNPYQVDALPSDPNVVPTKIRCTCYLDSGITKSGKITRHGVAAGKVEWLGKVGALYQVDEDGKLGDFIGYYEFLDTGAGIDLDGDGKGDSIRWGESIDIWQDSDASLKEWVENYGDYVYLLLIDGKG